eukprot:gene8472-9338_t
MNRSKLDLPLAALTSPRGESKFSRNSLRASAKNGRRSRQSNPYKESRPVRQLIARPPLPPGHGAIKFLLNNHYVGCIIGSGGGSVRDLMQITGATIFVSDVVHPYPGTTDRVVYITGSIHEVNFAQSLIWEMIGQQTDAELRNLRGVKWNPSLVNPLNEGTTGQYDEVMVYAHLSVPAVTGGAIVGKNGSFLKHLAAESGARVEIDDKDAADQLQTFERVITLEGTAASCMKCTALILEKISSVDDGCVYTFHANGYPRVSSSGVKTTRTTKGINDHPLDPTSMVISAHTTIEIAVPESMVGALFGVQGSTLNEMHSLSGAKILVSKRGEYVEGTTNRLVTIVGPPANAQTAHTLVLNKLRQAMTALEEH